MRNHGKSVWTAASRIAFVLMPLLTTSMPAPAAEPVRVVTSSRSGQLAPGRPMPVTPGTIERKAGVFEVNEKRSFQTITGFGASFMEAGMICLNSLDPQTRDEVLRALFDPDRGAGFSAMKTPLAGTDFMSAGPWYTYDDTPGDVELKHFSIARDLKPDGVVTFIRHARRHGRFVLQAPMDYPPDWMLTDVEDRAHQDVQDRYFPVLARYYLRYLEEYRKQGVEIDYLCLFNEPGIYTKISYARIRDLIKLHVGPLLEKSGLKTRIMLSEAENRATAAHSYPTVLDDPEARKYVAVLPYHGYGFKDFDLIRKLQVQHPGLPVWMTEVCYAYEAGTPTSLKLPVEDFADGDVWGNQIASDLEAGASAWIYWNMILDAGGGPWLVSPVHGNPDPNVQHPLVIIDRNTGKVTYTGAYFYLTHFSKFVRPGSTRLEVTGSSPNVRCLAFRTPDRKLVTVLINSGVQEAEVEVSSRRSPIGLRLAPISITTAIWDRDE